MKVKLDGEAKVFFSECTGLKIRASPKPYEKSATPELVDIKITDYCPYGCSFCYQSSTKKGQHATFARLSEYVDLLASLEVFELAIGGGEPSMHPDFVKFLYYTRDRGVVPNFTTFGVDWLKPEIIQAVNDTVGGIGVSVHSDKDLAKYNRIKKEVKVQVLAQHVLGTKSIKEVLAIVDQAEHVLLLGYKTVGFGSSMKPYQFHPDEIDAIFKSANKLSVDTAFLDLYGKDLDRLKIPKELRSSPEGKFSCYIDAVQQKMGPSSYTTDLKNFKVEEFLTNYKEY